MERIKNILIKLGSLDRRWIFLIITFAVLIPLIYPYYFSSPIIPSDSTIQTFKEMDNLGAGDKVLISFEYGPSTAPEIQPMAVALLKHLLYNDVKVYMMALWPEGQFMATDAVEETVQWMLPDKEVVDLVDYVHLGFKAGHEGVIKGVASDIQKLYTKDINNNSLDLMIKNDFISDKDTVFNIKDFQFVISLSAGSPGTEEWVQYACDPSDVPLLTGCTSIMVTSSIPYLSSGQLKGIIAGMPGAAEYEQLLNNFINEKQSSNIVTQEGMAEKGMASQSFTHLIIVLFIIFGNISYYLSRKEGN